MNSGYAVSALRQYQQVSRQAAAVIADPHRLVALLLDGALERLASAKGHTAAGALAEKSALIRATMGIIDGLRMSLNRQQGGEIAENLDQLYDYMNRRLLEANHKNDVTLIDEVIGLLSELKAGWDGIAPGVDEPPVNPSTHPVA